MQLKGSGSYVFGTVKCRSSNPSGANNYKSRMLTKFEQARCGPAGRRKRHRRLPPNTNATPRHRVILTPRFSDTIQLITVLLRQPTSTLSDEAPTGFTGQRGVCFCSFVNGVFAPKLRNRLSSGALLILFNLYLLL